MKALYGFKPSLSVFQGHSSEQQVNLLKSWGVDAIFGGYEDNRFVDAAHALGISVYAEFGCFRGKNWWEDIPDSRPITPKGSPLEPVDWYYGVNPSVLDVRQQLLTRLRELLSNYQVDGVWLDFIRWPCRWEKKNPQLIQTSFDPHTIQRFTSDTKIALKGEDTATQILTHHANEWTRWKCEQVRSWVAEARTIVDTVRPEVTLGMFAIPWLPNDFDGAITSIIGQDFDQLAPYIDVFSPMTYHRMCHRPVSWIETITSHLKQTTNKPVVPIIQSVDLPDVLPIDDYSESLEIAQSVGEGVIVFTLESMLEEKRLDATRQAFHKSG